MRRTQPRAIVSSSSCRESFLHEFLNAQIAAVGHVYETLTVEGNAVRAIELAGPGTLLSPVKLKAAIFREFRDTAVLVSIGDVKISLWGEGQVRYAVEVGGVRSRFA